MYLLRFNIKMCHFVKSKYRKTFDIFLKKNIQYGSIMFLYRIKHYLYKYQYIYQKFVYFMYNIKLLN